MESFSGFHCEYDYREWEDELLARLRIKRVDYLVDESYLKQKLEPMQLK